MTKQKREEGKRELLNQRVENLAAKMVKARQTREQAKRASMMKQESQA